MYYRHSCKENCATEKMVFNLMPLCGVKTQQMVVGVLLVQVHLRPMTSIDKSIINEMAWCGPHLPINVGLLYPLPPHITKD